jgi:hypothetical protein
VSALFGTRPSDEDDKDGRQRTRITFGLSKKPLGIEFEIEFEIEDQVWWRQFYSYY